VSVLQTCVRSDVAVDLLGIASFSAYDTAEKRVLITASIEQKIRAG